MPKFNEDIMIALRARARRSIQTIFASLAVGALIFSVYVHHNPGIAGLPVAESGALADAFLFLGTANALTMWVWDWLFWYDLDV